MLVDPEEIKVGVTDEGAGREGKLQLAGNTWEKKIKEFRKPTCFKIYCENLSK